MKARVKYTVDISSEEIDLEDYGHAADVGWQDLTEDEQNEIGDGLCEEKLIIAQIEPLKFT